MPCLLGVLGRQEEQRALRHDAEGLRIGVLHGRGDLRRARLVVKDDGDELVPVHATLRVLQVDPRFEGAR